MDQYRNETTPTTRGINPNEEKIETSQTNETKTTCQDKKKWY